MDELERQTILNSARTARADVEKDVISPLHLEAIPPELRHLAAEAEVLGASDEWAQAEMRGVVPDAFVTDLYWRMDAVRSVLDNWLEVGGGEPIGHERVAFINLKIFLELVRQDSARE